MGNEKQFAERMDANIKYKERLPDFIPVDAKRILDFGCGSGGLTKQIKRSRPNAEVIGLERDLALIEMAMVNYSAHRYTTDLTQLPKEYFDVIVLSSVIHEIDGVLSFLKELRDYLCPNGIIVIRDGIADKDNREVSYELDDPWEARTFYEDAGDSLIGNLPLTFEDGYVAGKTNDVRNFLQTYTWGYPSLYREKHEKFIRFTDREYREIGKEIGAQIAVVWETTQKEYFDYIGRLVVLNGETWPTHAIVVYMFKEGF